MSGERFTWGRLVSKIQDKQVPSFRPVPSFQPVKTTHESFANMLDQKG